MRKWIFALLVLSFLVLPVSAMSFTAPTAPIEAQKYMPDQQENFAEGLLYIIKSAVSAIRPELSEASGVCLSLIAIVLLVSILNSFTQSSNSIIRLTVAVVIGVLLLSPANTMIQLGAQTVTALSEYGKLMLPVMTMAVAAQGGTTSSAALYTGTVFFDALLTTFIARILVPALYIYLALCIANCAVEQDILNRMKEFIKWLMTWSLKWILFIFTGYISITGVISGTVDGSALKAAKMTISGAVPVVGSALSDAAETILLSAGIMKNAAGVYGILAVIALCVGPFLQIGIQYLLLQLSGLICNVFGYKPAAGLISDISAGMGMVLAMTGTVSMLILISLVCFMKGMG